MNLIFSADRNWGIGCDNDLLAHIPEDLKYFREKTTGKVVVMGERTLLSLPGSKPLPNRENFVLTFDENFKPEGVTVCFSKEEFLEIAKNYDGDDVFVIGGEQIYKLFLPHCKKAYVTKIDAEFPADRFMENLDELPEWSVESSRKMSTQSGVDIEFVTYVRV